MNTGFAFFNKTQKKQPLQQVSGMETPNLVLKRMLELFLKASPLKKILEFQNQKKKTMKLVQKENLEPKIKPIIENLQNELYQLENKHTKGAKKAPKLSSEYLKDRISSKLKQYLNDILMIIFQNILRTFLNMQKTL